MLLNRGLLMLLSLVSCVAVSDEVRWHIIDAAFDDGGMVAGFFDFDADTATFSDWSISITGGNTQLFPEGIATPDNSSVSQIVIFGDEIINFDLDESFGGGGMFETRDLRFHTLSEMTNAGGVIELGPQSGECYNCNPFRLMTSGSLSTIPEPATFVATGTLLAVIVIRRSSRKSR